jgi:uncharacterized membrane protein YjjB (DUF3815 family)
VVLMVPALFVWIPGDYLCAGTAELAVGQVTPGAVRLAQAAFTLFEIAAGVLIAAELSNVGTTSLFESTVPPTLPDWFIAVSWIVFTLGLVLAFSARIRDYPWMLALVYLAWGVQLGVTKIVGPTVGTFAAGAVLAIAGGPSRSVTTATAKDRPHPRGLFRTYSRGACAARACSHRRWPAHSGLQRLA